MLSLYLEPQRAMLVMRRAPRLRWVWLIALQGCIEFGVSSVPEDDPPTPLVSVTERFQQEPQAAVDLLFVVDNTASMAQEHEALAGQLTQVAQALDEASVRWHLAVVTTDMNDPFAGWLVGTPYLLTSHTPDLQTHLAARVQVGTQGALPAAGFAAAIRAVELAHPEGPNAGFRRPDAVLHVVFISDTDDGSEAWLGPDPVGAFLDWLEDEAQHTGVPALASGVIGDIPSGCVSILGAAQPAFRYHALIAEAGGQASSICSANFGPLLAQIGDVSLSWSQDFPLREAPLPGSLRVWIEGEPQGEGWALNPDPPVLHFDSPPPPSAQITVTYLVENA